MIFFKKKSDDSRARRSARLRISQLRSFSLIVGLFAIVVSAGFAGYHSGIFKKFDSWTRAQVLAFTENAGFKVKDILVTGRMQIPAAELLDRLSIKQGMPLFGVNIADAQKSLADIAWVKSVAISRRLPDKVFVDLQERTPVALWQYQKKISLIDQEGMVLPVADLAAYKDLPLVVGADVPQRVMALLGLLKAEPDISAQMVSAVRVGGRRWDLHLRNDVVVKLPEQDAELALSSLATAEKQKNILGKNIASIDLRQPEKMIVMPLGT